MGNLLVRLAAHAPANRKLILWAFTYLVLKRGWRRYSMLPPTPSRRTGLHKVAKVELYHVKVPQPAWFWPSWIPGYPQTDNRFDLLRVLTDTGFEGWAAGHAVGKERAGLGELLGPYFIEEDACDMDLIRQRFREISYLGWRVHWAEAAFWDIKGKIEGKSLCEMLGGQPKELELYSSMGTVLPPEELVRFAEARYAEGFRTIKMRVHGTEEEDIEQMTALCRAVGHKMKVGVDVNQGWRVSAVSDAPKWDLARAKRFADKAAELGCVAWIEEPLPYDDYADLAELTAYSQVPISGGELNQGSAELKMMIERKCFKIYQPDAVFAGGISQCFEVAQLCKEHGATFTPHTWSNGIGFAINMQLYGLSTGDKPLEFPYQPPGWTVEARDALLKTRFEHTNGRLQMPSTPGIGVEIDRAALRKYGTRYFAMDKPRLAVWALCDRGLKACLHIKKMKEERQAAARKLAPKL